MSPEQVEGKKLDARSDIFSFGSVLYEMLTGRRAFPGGSHVSIVSTILRDSQQSSKELRPAVPGGLQRSVLQCLEKNREERYLSGAELHADLAACQTQLAAREVGIWPLVRKPWVAIPALALVALALAIGGWYSWRASGVRWARMVALPEIGRLLDQERTCAALRLARQAEGYLPSDPELERVRQNSRRRGLYPHGSAGR